MHEQHAIWSRVARERDEVIGAFHTPMWNAMLDTVLPKVGAHMLDAGCGSGGASELCVGRGGIVTGIDLSAEMIKLCRARPKLADSRFEVGSLEDLPFADGTFDGVMASMVVHFCPDPVRALRELARVAKPGARVAISAPSSPDHDILLALYVSAELRPEDAVDIKRPLMFAPEGKLAAALETIGLREITEQIVDLQVGPMPFESAWGLVKTFAPVRTTIDRIGEQQFLDAYLPRIRHCFEGDTIMMSSKYRVVSGLR